MHLLPHFCHRSDGNPFHHNRMTVRAAKPLLAAGEAAICQLRQADPAGSSFYESSPPTRYAHRHAMWYDQLLVQSRGERLYKLYRHSETCTVFSCVPAQSSRSRSAV